MSDIADRVKKIVVEHLGADSIIVCEVDKQPLAVREEGFSRISPGDEIRISWDASNEHQFDPATGCRLAKQAAT